MAGKITGSSKLAKKPTKEKEPLNLIKAKKSSTLKPFRMYDSDLRRLQKIVEKMNEESQRHISETAAIRALLVLGAKTSGTKLIKSLRETI